MGIRGGPREAKMGITERREREREQRRNEIIDAAQRVFFARGWEVATMDDVAAEAELGKATLYLYFKSKEELYVAILVRGLGILHSMFSDVVDRGGPGLQMVEGIGRAYLSFQEKHHEYFNALTYFDSKNFESLQENQCFKECESQKKKTMGLVARAVQTGMDDGSIRRGLDPTKAALILWAQTSGLLKVLSIASENIKSYYGLEPADIIEAYFDLTFHSLAALPPEGAGEP